MYVIYDAKYYEQVVAIFDKREEVSKYLNMDKDCVSSAISKGNKIHGRYIVNRIEVPEDEI